ncbi:hypothetical protein Tco_0939413 [Tanacetum coccineum]|uniref:Uncharacterized protein n=1 Tax=Tanacetum coccineum TaxID=301880 RepID=A0ABQ5DKW8_9ASTR
MGIPEYNELLEKIITTVRQIYGEKIHVQFEGFHKSLRVKRSIQVLKATELWNVHVDQSYNDFKGNWNICILNDPEFVMDSSAIEDQEKMDWNVACLHSLQVVDDGLSAYEVWCINA